MSLIAGTSAPRSTSPSAYAARKRFITWGDVVAVLASIKATEEITGPSKVRPVMSKLQVWQSLYSAASTFHANAEINWSHLCSLTALNTYREFVADRQEEEEVESCL